MVTFNARFSFSDSSLPADVASGLPREVEAEMQGGGESHSTGEEQKQTAQFHHDRLKWTCWGFRHE